MIIYKKIYINYFDYCEQDFIPCELCSRRSVDIHHIDNKGMGGSKEKDYIENLIALCRECHIEAHNGEQSIEMLVLAHRNKVQSTNKPYDKEKFLNLIK